MISKAPFSLDDYSHDMGSFAYPPPPPPPHNGVYSDSPRRDISVKADVILIRLEINQTGLLLNSI